MARKRAAMQDFAPIITKIADFLAPECKTEYHSLPDSRSAYRVSIERMDGTRSDLHFTLEKYTMTVSFDENLVDRESLDTFLAELEYQEEQSRLRDVIIRTSLESGHWHLHIEA